MLFNYYTYKGHVFDKYNGSIWKYISVYLTNYLVNLTLLYIIHKIIKSPYVDGVLAAAVGTILNYVLLKVFVFKRKANK
jgi:putative flippase GtrA